MRQFKPAHMKRLEAAYDLDAYKAAYEFFKAKGVSIGYSTIRRSWFFFAIGRMDGPTTVICWVGLEAFVDMLDTPSQTLKDMAAQGAAIKG